MFEVSKKVVIYRRENNSAFAKANRIQISLSYNPHNKIGSSISAVNKMTECSDELKTYMPTILGISPTDNSWGTKINEYWNSISVPVPDHGLPLEIGFKFSLDDSAKAQAIKELIAKTKIEEKEDVIGNYIATRVDESNKYKYSTPINTSNYLLWRYCLNYRDVANKIEDVAKSAHIRFYIHDENIRQQIEEEIFKVKSKAETKYYEILPNRIVVENILTIFGHNVLMFKSEIAKHKTLRGIVDTRPNEFLNIEKDKTLQIKAFIEKCVMLNLLKRYPNSTAIVDVENNDTIGMNVDNVVVYLNDVKNKDVLSRLQTMCITKEKEYTALPK